MKKSLKVLSLVAGTFALGATLQAQVNLTIDNTTTLSTTAWSGSPALGLNPPNGGSSVDGNVLDSVIFQPTSTFTLGSFEFYAGSGGAGATSIGNYVISLYNLGSSYTIPGSSPYYTFTGSEADLFDAGLNFTTTSDDQFNVLTFSGDDQVSLIAGDTYDLTIQENGGVDGNEIMDIERGNNTTGSGNPNFATQGLGESTADYADGVAVNFVPAGRRDVVGAFYPVAPAPEPTTLALFGLGGLAGSYMIRRRKA